MKLGFVGDIQLGGGVRELCEKHGDDFPFRLMNGVFQRFDYLVGNLECCIVDGDAAKVDVERGFAVDRAMMRALRESGFSALNLANNHILDYGVESLGATIAAADAEGVEWFGAGNDIAAATAIREVICDGYRVAFLGAGDRSQYYAGTTRGGVMPLERNLLRKRVREAAGTADLVAVSLHADIEFSDIPAPWRIRLCRWLVDQGADLVICHHPHVVQGIEEYRGGVIAYSLGNFVFRIQGNRYQEKRTDTDWGLLLGIDVRSGENGVWLRPELVPVKITEEHRPAPVEAVEYDRLMEKMEQRSSVLRDARAVRRKWRTVCWREARRLLFGVYYSIRRGEYRDARGMLGAVFREPERRRWLIGLLSGGYV